MDLLQGKSLLQKGNELISADIALKKKNLILFYFTSFHCDACRVFDSKLKDVYREALSRRLEMAVIVVSGDSSEESYLNNILSNYLDWYCVPYEDDLSQTLLYSFGITHVPTLIVVARNGTIISREGIKDIEQIGINVLVTWTE